MSRVVKFLRASPARLLVALIVVCILIAALADGALYQFQPTGIRPATLSQHPLQPGQAQGPGSCAQAAQSQNPIAAENTCPGTRAWQTVSSVGGESVEGFASPSSVDVGQEVRFYVSTSSPVFVLKLYRLGWYGGAGGHLLYTSPRITGKVQPHCLFLGATRTVSCTNWVDPVGVHVPKSWVCGEYEAQFVAYKGATGATIFVVRNDASRAPIGVVLSLSTYQAYNMWGGYSLYASNVGPPGTWDRNRRSLAVSFDRPYDGSGLGLGVFAYWDADMIRWLERENYNVSYMADVDLQLSPGPALQHRLLIFPGHSEYWSTGMRQTLEHAVAVGISAAFMGGNNIYWHTRLEPSAFGPGRLVVCYRVASLDPLSASEPSQTTVAWQNPPVNDPAQDLLGEMYAGIASGTSALMLTPGIPSLFANTGLSSGMSLPGLVGGEYDHIWSTLPTPGTVVKLADSTVICKAGQDVCDSSGHAESDATIYTASSGARVFDAGTFQWSWGLDSWGVGITTHTRDYANVGFQKFNANLIAYLLHEPLPGAQATPTA